MKKVLIVGNGISRLKFADQIESYEGEIWASNYAFRDFPAIITRLNGHTDPLVEAWAWKQEHGFKYEIYAGPIARKNPYWKTFSCPPKWHRDSGTTNVAQALFEGFDQIDLVGFDLCGADVHSPGHERVDKTSWVVRWSEIAQEWGLDKLNFWGHCHKEFILSVLESPIRAKDYARDYKARRPHIPGDDYKEIFRGFFMAKEKEKEKLVEIVYANGYKTMARESIAAITVGKGAAVYADGKKAKASKTDDGGGKKEGQKTDDGGGQP